MKILNQAPLGFMQSRIMSDEMHVADIIKIGLVAYWKMDEASGTRADSIPVPVDSALTDVNTVGSAAGVIGDSASFQLVNMESLQVAPNGDVDPPDSFTIAGWVKFNTIPAADFSPIFQKFASGAGNADYALTYNSINSTWRFFIGGANVGNTVTAAVISDTPTTGDWHFFCAIYNEATQTQTIRINEVLTATASPVNGLNNGPESLTFGVNGSTANDWLDGRLDEIGLWHRAISPAECAFLFNNRLGRTYPFDPADVGEGEYNNAFDNSFWSAPL